MDQNILLSACGILFAGNIFFFRKVAEKVEKNSTSNERMEAAIEKFDSQLKDLKQDMKDLRKIEIDVAILKNDAQKRNEL